MTRLSRFILAVVSFAIVAASVAAQTVLPTTGTHFTFAIPEGADNLVDQSTGQTDSSRLYLYFVSSTAGTATISSPSGYSKTISFCKDTATVFELPYYLMHLHEVGKTNKAVIVESSVPIQLVFHDYFLAGGEVTQLYPDDALDTSYTIATWGLYNDVSINWSTGTFNHENNKTEFVIAAPYDSTIVTITPAVAPIGIPNSFPQFTIRLNRGEAFMVKADSTSLPTYTSLSGSRVSSNKPVSVISASTCGYVPALPFEACNELLNMELPKRFTDTIYYTAGFSGSPLYALLYISDIPSFFVITSGGQTYQTNTGVLLIPTVGQPMKTFVTAPAKCYQLSVSVDATGAYGFSDPSIFNVLPRSLYIDSLQWYAPDNLGVGQYDVQFVSIIYPQTAESQITLDGKPIMLSASTPQAILGTGYSTMIIQVLPGIHKVISPEPIYAYASGFDLADSYSYNLTGILPPSQFVFDTIKSTMAIDTSIASSSASVAFTCRDFAMPVRLLKDPIEYLTSIRGEFRYDPQIASLLSVEPKTAPGTVFTSDISIPGVIHYTVTGTQITATNDTLCILHFHANAKPLLFKVLSKDTLESIADECSRKGTKNLDFSQSLSINEARDTMFTAFAMSIDSSRAGELATATIDLTKPLADPITSLTVQLKYDHDLLELVPPSPLTRTIDPQTDEFTIDFNPPYNSSIIGELLKLSFKVFVSKATKTDITASFMSIGNKRDCPLDILAPQVSAQFGMRDTCATILLRQQLNGTVISLTRIVPNPVTESMSIEFDHALPLGQATILITNVLGQTLRTWNEQISASQMALHSPNLSDLKPGTYFFDISTGGIKFSGSFLIRN
ncbi:MAG TPA: T9SS type A sorting domain-containing protein [Candidatus Kapabacteria bacterium]|nr:T9SS type A sorting domain-containing protein [Candidatus Kapabacteria bacterium]